MGVYRRLFSRITGGLVKPSRPASRTSSKSASTARSKPKYQRNEPRPAVVGSEEFAWGKAFGADQEGVNRSNTDKEFTWYVAGWKPIHGERQDLEATPKRVLTDAEIRRADYLVIHFSGDLGYKVIGGPFDDWDMIWSDVAGMYDEGDS